MTAYFGVQSTLVNAGSEPPVNEWGGRVRCINETFVYASQASGSTITVATLPAGAQPLGFELLTDTSTGSATLACGTSASSAKYIAASAYTTTDVPQLLGKTATALTALTVTTTIILTTAAASLPASGNLVFQTYYLLD